MARKRAGLLLQVEIAVDRALPVVLIALAALIIASFVIDIEHYQPWVGIADSIILAFFIVDLFFKWRHARNIVKFVKLYWLDIVAVFPFYLLFRAFLAFSEFVAGAETAQQILHEAILAREAKLIREARFLAEAEFVAKEERLVVRVIRLAQRVLRFIALRWHTVHLGFLHAHRRHRRMLLCRA